MKAAVFSSFAVISLMFPISPPLKEWLGCLDYQLGFPKSFI